MADDAAMAGVSGNAVVMSHSRSIRMVDEHVAITDLPDGKVTAIFHFRNEGPATDALIGFPEYADGDTSVPDQGTSLQDFKSWVDGKPIRVTRLRSADKPGDEPGRIGAAFWVKRVHFAAGQTRTITDTYSGGGGGDSTGFRYYKYVLSSGATWKGPIGSGTVTCDISGVEPYTVLDISAGQYVRKGSLLTWSFRNLKPTDGDDITIDWFPAFLRVVVNGRQVSDSNHSGLPEPSMKPVYYSGPTADETTPRRRGNDVQLSAEDAATWLGAAYTSEKGGTAARIQLGRQWVRMSAGSQLLTASNGKRLRAAETPYCCTDQNGSDQSDEKNRVLMITLGPVVRALGGSAEFDLKRDVMKIRLPKER